MIFPDFEILGRFAIFFWVVSVGFRSFWLILGFSKYGKTSSYWFTIFIEM